MADNIDVSPGTGKTIAADEIAGVLHQRVKISQGVDGSATDVSASDPLNVTLANTGANATAIKVDGSAVTQPVSGTVTANAGTGSFTVAQATATNLKTQAEAYQGGSAVASGNPLEVNLRSSTVSVATSTKQSDGSQKTQVVDGSGNVIGATSNALDVNIKSNAAAIPAGTNLIGQTSASLETSTIYNGTTALTPKFAVISASSSGNNTIVTAVTGKKIRVLAVQVNATAAVNLKWQSGASGTDLTGLNYATANGGYVLPFSPVGWFETASNTLLNLNLSAANAVGGSITYVEV